MNPTIVLTSMRGHMDREIAAAFIAGLDEWMRMGGTGLQAFHDWSGVDDYDGDARVLLTPWSKERAKAFSSVHLLVRGRALAWGIQIVNAIIGGLMTTHHERCTFEKAFGNTGSPSSYLLR